MTASSSAAYWNDRANLIASPLVKSGALQNAMTRSRSAAWTNPKMIELINKIVVKNYVPPDPVKLLATDFAARQAKVMESIAAPRINAVKTELLTSQALTGLIASNTVIGSQFKFSNVKALLDSIDLGEIDVEEVDEDDDLWELSGVVEEEFEHLPEDVRETLSDRQRLVIRKTIQALLTLELIFVLMVIYGEIPGLPDQGGWIGVVVTMMADVRRVPAKLVDWADKAGLD